MVTLMSRLRVFVLLLSSGFVVSPMASLYCDARDAADMACCQGDMAECNQPGKTENCCQVAPTSQESAAIVGKAPDQRVALDAVVLPVLSLSTLPPPAVHPRVTWSVALQVDPSPPRASVLRL